MKRFYLCSVLIASMAGSVCAADSSAGKEGEPTSRPATRPNPQGDPASAVKYLFELIAKGDYAAVRRVNLESATVTQLQEIYERVAWAMNNGYSITVAETHVVGPVASVICQVTDGKVVEHLAVIVIERFDDWKVEFSGQPNLRRLSPGERSSLVKANEWRSKRLAELRPTTRPATQPAPAGP